MKGLFRFLRAIITMRLAVLLLFQVSVGTHATCPCNGVVVEGSDQKHCWEVVTREAATWVDADIACQTVGGHLGHPQGTWSDTVYRYVRSSYTKPVLTGIVAGSAEANLYAMVCPNNKFYGLLPKNITFYQEATNTDTCAYFTTQSGKLTFASCTLDAHALCDRPMEKADYCNTVITCTTTTTTTSTSSMTTTTSSTSSDSSIKRNSTTSTTTATYIANLTTSTSTSSTTTTTESVQENVSTDTSTTASSNTSTPSISTTLVNLVTSTSSLISSTESRSTANTKPPSKVKPIWDTATNSTSPTTSTTTSMPIISQNTTSINITTTPSGAVVVVEPASCTKPGCGKHEWSIFGWCTDWRSLLLLAALLLALFLLICLLHCCCKLCIDPCQVKRKKEEKLVKNETAKDPPVPKPKPTGVKKISEETFPRNSCYDVDQSSILPPPATVTQPVFVPVPVHHSEEGALKKVDPELRFISPPKPDTVDVGVNTDSWPLEKEFNAKKPTKADKVQVRRAPTVNASLVEVDDYSADDPADDVSLHLEQWHGAERQPKSEMEFPKGDIVDDTPFVFMQNPKPRRGHSDEPKRASAPQANSEQDEPQKIEGLPPNREPVRSNAPAEDKPVRGSRSFRSPPPSQRSEPAEAMRSTLRDNKTCEQRRIPSPPKRTENTESLKRDAPRSRDSDNGKSYNVGGATAQTENDTVTRPKEKRPPLSPQIAEESRRKLSNDTKDMTPSDNNSFGPEDSAKKARSRSPTSRSTHRPLRSREERPVIIPTNHHFAPHSSDSSSAGGSTWRSTSSKNVSDAGSPTLPKGHVSMRNPRGRMGGVVRAGGGGGETPVGWKPWSKASSSLSQKQQFLADD